MANHNRVPVEVRFWAKVNRNGPIVIPELGPCWVWTGATVRRGYGSILGNGATEQRERQQSHRFSWELHHGPIPGRLCVLHRCDNPPCVNPTHLFLGTRRDNTEDMMRKGRHVTARGEASGMARLTERDARAIIAARAAGEAAPAIARRFGVNRRTVYRIAGGQRWPHLHQAMQGP